MINAEDLYYLPRIENLERQYEKLNKELAELKQTFDEYLEYEKFTALELNLISSQIQTCEELMKAIKEQRNTLRLQTLN